MDYLGQVGTICIPIVSNLISYGIAVLFRVQAELSRSITAVESAHAAAFRIISTRQLTAASRVTMMTCASVHARVFVHNYLTGFVWRRSRGPFVGRCSHQRQVQPSNLVPVFPNPPIFPGLFFSARSSPALNLFSSLFLPTKQKNSPIKYRHSTTSIFSVSFLLFYHNSDDLLKTCLRPCLSTAFSGGFGAGSSSSNGRLPAAQRRKKATTRSTTGEC